MTVISTIITRHCTAHASDSFLTEFKTGRIRKSQQSKLVRVPHLRGAMGYWGLAWLDDGWDTFQWLRNRAERTRDTESPAAFADACAAELTTELSRRRFADPRDSGLGIHFTAYEYMNGCWIPELWVLSRWTDATYRDVLPAFQFRVTRETYATLKGLNPPGGRSPAEVGQASFRREVHAALHDAPLMFRFNNGDPALFNPIAKCVLDTFAQLSSREQLTEPSSVETHLSIARRPVEIVSRLLADFAAPATRLIGGKPHDLAVNSGGIYQSTTGD
jgi:hypothetical protein